MNFNPIILEVLKNRGVEDIEEFLSSKPQLIHDPSLFHEMDKAVDLILEAIDLKKKICIYGDYDVDGITSTALLMKLLIALGALPEYYIPSRFDGGYGLNEDAILELKEKGVDLIITVDCGIVSVSEVEYAKSLGMEILITDHHDQGDALPDTIIIDPKVKYEQYPFKELSGCGVTFKLAQSIQRKLGLKRSLVTSLLDLVAVATIADIVLLVDENRTLTKYGMGILNAGNNLGLNKLIEKIGLKLGEINSYHIAYIIAPHINAAGRMGRANIAVELLISEDAQVIDEAADFLIEQNNKRKSVQEKAFELCDQIVKEKLMNDPILIINAGNIHEGIIGIVAGKIKTKYNKPTLVMTDDGDVLKGSGRSVDGIDMHEAMLNHSEIFEKFGGHAMACGFTILKDREKEFTEKLREEFSTLKGNDFKEADAVLMPTQITSNLVQDISLLEPFGKGNEAPEFKIENVILSDINLMGENGKHARFKADGLNCIFFNYDIELEDGMIVSLAGSPQVDEWKGKKQLKFNVKGVK